MSQLQVNRINDASGGVLAPISSVMRNRIINGAMTISQRGTSFSYNGNSDYCLDRFRVRYGSNGGTAGTATVTQSSVAPAGFVSSLLLTVGTARTVVSGDRFNIEQSIEGFNTADLAWGTAGAKPITLSFWVRSSLTGTFGLCFSNFSRGYAATYTISAANTWEYKTVSIVGDTSGTWNTTNSTGFFISFDIGMGSDVRTTTGSWQAGTFLGASGSTNVVSTAGATFAITGVQLEVGTQATSFEYRQYGTELALCQRYYEELTFGTVTDGYIITAGAYSATQGEGIIRFSVVKRATPTMASSGTIQVVKMGGGTVSGLPAGFTGQNIYSSLLFTTSASGLTTGQVVRISADSSTTKINASAEL